MKFFRHIDEPMKYMVNKLKVNQAPSDIVNYYREIEMKLTDLFSKAERNDPCPCGSGKKFKLCHGKSVTGL